MTTMIEVKTTRLSGRDNPPFIWRVFSLYKEINFQFFPKNAIFFEWLYRLTVRTRPSQGLNPGSIPGRVTK